MADQPARRRFPIVATSEPQPRIEELIDRLARLHEERLRLIEQRDQLRDKMLWMIEDQKKRADGAWAKAPDCG